MGTGCKEPSDADELDGWTEFLNPPWFSGPSWKGFKTLVHARESLVLQANHSLEPFRLIPGFEGSSFTSPRQTESKRTR